MQTRATDSSKRSNSPSNGPLASLSGSAANFPQSLEELLETQWEQGGTFLMEQAQHFDSEYHLILELMNLAEVRLMSCNSHFKLFTGPYNPDEFRFWETHPDGFNSVFFFSFEKYVSYDFQ